MENPEHEIETRLAELEPEVEVIAIESQGPEALRVYIDHPQGVDLALCERVTKHLRELLSRYSLEVSSPGLDRPLTKPEHFRRFLGRRVRVRTQEAIEGRRNFTGTLAGADERLVRVEDSGQAVEIPLSGIHRSNLVPELPEVHR